MIECLTGSQPRGQRLEPVFEGDVKAVSQEADENMRVDPRFDSMVNGPDAQIVFEAAEHRLDLDQEDVEFPQVLGLFAAEVAPEQVIAVVEFDVPEFGLVQFEAEGLAADFLTGLG